MRFSSFTASVALALTLASFASTAQADDEADKNNKAMDAVDRAFKAFTKNPKFFDGQRVPPGTSSSDLIAHSNRCMNGVNSYLKYMAALTPRGKATARAKAIAARYKTFRPHCDALASATEAYVRDVNAKANASRAAQAEAKKLCGDIYRDVANAVGGGVKVHTLLDTVSGARTQTSIDSLSAFRGLLGKATKACSKPAYREATNTCASHGRILSSASNRNYSYADLCRGALAPEKTMKDLAMRYLEHYASARAKELPTPASFAQEEGWIEEETAIRYDSYFRLGQADKKRHEAELLGAFKAAGVAPPADLSVAWRKQQDYLDALKVVVDKSAGNWQIKQAKCTDYTCKLAKKAIGRSYRGAKVKGVFQRDWKIYKNNLGVTTHRSHAVFILFQVKGEPYCQARSMSASEPYKGGGRFQKAKRLDWGYVRFQKC